MCVWKCSTPLILRYPLLKLDYSIFYGVLLIIMCFAHVPVAWWKRTSLYSILPCVQFCLFSFPKETRAYKQGGSWRYAVVQLLKQMFGRVEQLCALHSVFSAVGCSVKRYCSIAQTWCKRRKSLRWKIVETIGEEWADSWHFPKFRWEKLSVIKECAIQ